jgi:hypothetical protein
VHAGLAAWCQNMDASSAAAAALAPRCNCAAGAVGTTVLRWDHHGTVDGAAAATVASKGAPSMPPADCISLTMGGTRLRIMASSKHMTATYFAFSTPRSRLNTYILVQSSTSSANVFRHTMQPCCSMSIPLMLLLMLLHSVPAEEVCQTPL